MMTLDFEGDHRFIRANRITYRHKCAIRVWFRIRNCERYRHHISTGIRNVNRISSYGETVKSIIVAIIRIISGIAVVDTMVEHRMSNRILLLIKDSYLVRE